MRKLKIKRIISIINSKLITYNFTKKQFHDGNFLLNSKNIAYNFSGQSQQTFTFWKSRIETLQNGMIYVQS